jgi:hypothetical protein
MPAKAPKHKKLKKYTSNSMRRVILLYNCGAIYRML